VSYDSKEKSQLGGAPLELYYFQSGSNYWCYTSGDTAVSYAGRDFAPARSEEHTSELQSRLPQP
jgi:hypothetical protein